MKQSIPSRRELVEVVAAEDDAGVDLELLETLVQLGEKFVAGKF